MIIVIVSGQVESDLITKMHALQWVTAIYLRYSDNTKIVSDIYELRKVSDL